MGSFLWSGYVRGAQGIGAATARGGLIRPATPNHSAPTSASGGDTAMVASPGFRPGDARSGGEIAGKATRIPHSGAVQYPLSVVST